MPSIRRERGQMVVISALLIPILLGMTAMAVDLGSYASQRRSMQNAADSIALAAGDALPDTTAAQASAASWAAKNGIAANEYSIQISTTGPNPTVHVTVKQQHNFAFIKVLGISEKDVGAKAAAAKFSFGGSAGVVPWSVTQATLDASTSGSQVVLKYDATGVNTGNFGAITIDGNGSSDYQTAATYGSASVICAAGTPDCTSGSCPGNYPDPCAETAPECDGPDCLPKTGNMVGPTQSAVDFRMQHTSQACDTFEEAFTPLDPSSSGKYALNSNCNPWTGGACPPAPSTALCSRRVIIIPVIDQFGSGSSDPVTVQRFALMWLDGYDAGKCQGNSCEIKARFVNADLTTGALAGFYSQNSTVKFTKLVE